jgi:hypothetical protein
MVPMLNHLAPIPQEPTASFSRRPFVKEIEGKREHALPGNGGTQHSHEIPAQTAGNAAHPADACRNKSPKRMPLHSWSIMDLASFLSHAVFDQLWRCRYSG